MKRKSKFNKQHVLLVSECYKNSVPKKDILKILMIHDLSENDAKDLMKKAEEVFETKIRFVKKSSTVVTKKIKHSKNKNKSKHQFTKK